MTSILVVDDQPDNLVVLRRFLADGGHEVETARDAEEALEIVERGERFDLFVVDVVLPGIDGFALCERIRERPQTAQTPVLFVSGQRDALSDRLLGFESGANDYLAKPVDRRELLARVSVLLRLATALRAEKTSGEKLRDVVESRTAALRGALESLAAQKELLESVLHGLPAAVVATDETGRIVSVNAVARERFDRLEVGSPLAETCLAPVLETVGGDTEATRVRIDCACCDDRLYEVERSLLEGKTRGWLFHLADVTDRAEALECERARDVGDLLAEIEVLKGELHGRYRMSEVIGVSAGMAQVHRAVQQLRTSGVTVLVEGESGTGKELVARAIHFDGDRRDRPFVPVHCGAIPDTLAESEFFGHAKGAFTGAAARAPGLFVVADGGTLFLDEISECSLDVQGKLLRVLQSGEIRPVGSTEVRCVDVRLIAATNRDLRELVGSGAFREDLYYRLDVVSLVIPPLRERVEDIPLLAAHFLRKQAVLARRPADFDGIDAAALRALERYDWPGNVRELENVFVRAAALAEGPTIRVEDLPERLHALGGRVAARAAAEDTTELRLVASRKLAERAAIAAALRACGGNKVAAARRLGIGKSSLYRKLRDLGLSRRAYGAS